MGAYPVAINWHYTPAEAEYLFNDSGIKALVIHADLLESEAGHSRSRADSLCSGAEIDPVGLWRERCPVRSTAWRYRLEPVASVV